MVVLFCGSELLRRTGGRRAIWFDAGWRVAHRARSGDLTRQRPDTHVTDTRRFAGEYGKFTEAPAPPGQDRSLEPEALESARRR